jgi:hypothetical protein
MKIVATGVLSRGEPGTPRACLTFGTATHAPDGTLLATLLAGSTKDSADERIEIWRSHDDGTTWNGPEHVFPSPRIAGNDGTLKLCYLTAISGDRLIAAAMWVDRTSYPGAPLFDPETEGCLPMAILLAESGDSGRTWSEWRVVPMPEEIGPPSLTSPLLRLADGRLAMSIETNKPYRDRSKWMQRAVFFFSEDDGQTWSAPHAVAEDPTGRIFNWDLRCATAPDGRIASFAWTYDSVTAAYRDIHRRVSADGGAFWTAPEALGFADQAGRPAIRPDGSIVLPWVDRFGSRTIKARMAPALDAPFDPASEVVLYSHAIAETGKTDTGDMLQSMEVWSFGLPYAESLPGDDVLVLFYAGATGALDIHWVRLGPEG